MAGLGSLECRFAFELLNTFLKQVGEAFVWIGEIYSVVAKRMHYSRESLY